MKNNPGFILLLGSLYLFAAAAILFNSSCKSIINKTSTCTPVIAEAGEVKSLESGNKWSRCFRAGDGTIYFEEPKMSVDGGKTIVDQTATDMGRINGAPERAVFAKGNMFYALDGPTSYISPGLYKGRSWRSHDNLTSIHEEESIFYIPDGIKPRKDVSKWFGLFVYRTIIELPDGVWLMTMYGNFSEDTLKPYNRDAIMELEFMQRTFIVTSDDQGRTWKFHATVAIPQAAEPIGEGFVEPAITLLKDGRLLCIMRSGHHYPLYASWSNDLGKTWSPPLYTGFDRGCDPCLITLSDGRVALSWGKRHPEGVSMVTPEGDKGLFVYPGKGFVNLSISSDEGHSWETRKIIQPAGSCYSTIIEVEPGVIFMQADQWYCRIKLNPLRS